jgi:hypothetical protein
MRIRNEDLSGVVVGLLVLIGDENMLTYLILNILQIGEQLTYRKQRENPDIIVLPEIFL